MIELPEQLFADFQRAFNRHDLDGILALYEPGAVLVTAQGSVEGIDAIGEAYRRLLAARPTIHLQLLAMHRAGDLALLQGRWIVHSAARGARLSQGRSTEVARLQPDGRWLFIIDNPRTPTPIPLGMGNGGH
jgi:uncharacterized protein (TIGR02246 family)